MTAGHDRRALGHRVVDSRRGAGELLGADQRAVVRAPAHGRVHAQSADTGEEPVHEGVVGTREDVDPLDPDAQLAGVVEARPHGDLGRPPGICILEHDHRVLPAELHRAADEPLTAPAGDLRTHRARAGEHHVVRALGDLRAQLGTVPEHDLQDPPGDAGAVHEVHGPQGGQRRLVVGLEHHRVARHERGDRIGGGQEQRVVPRCDVAHHTDRMMLHRHLREQREEADLAVGPEQSAGVPRVVPGDRAHPEELLEGVHPGLAGLPLDQVQALVAVRQQQVVEPQHSPLAFDHRRVRPPAPGPPAQCRRPCPRPPRWRTGSRPAAGRRRGPGSHADPRRGGPRGSSTGPR